MADRAAVHQAVDMLLDALAAPSGTGGDELIALERAALERHGFEHAPVVRLAEEGTLRSVKIGRKRYTTRAWLVELAASLPPARSAERGDDEVTAAARRKAARKAAAA
jgi:hypothetical protein